MYNTLIVGLCIVMSATGLFPLGCAYKNGICAMCGKRIIDVKDYKQSTV